MKIYLASRYSRRDQLRELAAELTRMGHEITSRWLQTEFVNRPNESSAAPPEYREKYALIDMEDVKAADCVINFTEAPGDGSRGGRHVELGLAVAWGKRIIVVGYRENLFHHLPIVEFYVSQWGMLRALDESSRLAKNLRAGIEDLQKENIRLLHENQIHKDKAAGNYWAWQGDGSDRLESLVCPVLIAPSVLKQILDRTKVLA